MFPKINEERLWANLMQMARIGATPKGGVCRVALTEEDKAGRDLFVQWCKDAGCSIRIDAMGNLFARRPGKNSEAKAVLIGSHLDSQPTGGKFDGVYGVLAALEVVETLNDHQIQTEAPIEMVSWTNEEGARFAPAMIASGVFAREFSLEYAYSRTDTEGKTLEDELTKIGYKGTDTVTPELFSASLEVHIEQGPILEAKKKTVGVVTGVQGIRWYDLIIQGKETHAGPSPMWFRKDPVQYALPLLEALYTMVDDYAPDGKLTVGYLDAHPGVRNTVPGQLKIALDIRHPDELLLTAMHDRLTELVQIQQANYDFEASLEEVWHSPAIQFAPECIAAVKNAATALNVSHMKLFSGAGHDAVYVSKVVPTSMIFIPCKDGLSHNELESAKKEDITAGANVLLQATVALANSKA